MSPPPCNQIHSIHSGGRLVDLFVLIFTAFAAFQSVHSMGGLVDLFVLIFTAFAAFQSVHSMGG